MVEAILLGGPSGPFLNLSSSGWIIVTDAMPLAHDL